ncbi:MAG: DUF4129 domain-containing protein [Microthrixaceae bacterium]|nr:DUF4129 domain-containing protein [Microthrixaceae bacterium]
MLAEGPTRDQVRDAAAEVFRRGEFQQRKSLLQRFMEWLAGLFDESEMSPPELRPGGGSALGELLLYLLLAVLVVLAIWLIVRAVRARVRKSARVEPEDPEARLEEERPASEWRSDAERAESEGRWKDAMRDRYRELVAELTERRVLPDVPGRTTGELRADMAEHEPPMADPFSEACLLFELPWYADLPTGAEENSRIRQLTDHILAETEGARRRDGRSRRVPVEVSA